MGLKQGDRGQFESYQFHGKAGSRVSKRGDKTERPQHKWMLGLGETEDLEEREVSRLGRQGLDKRSLSEMAHGLY